MAKGNADGQIVDGQALTAEAGSVDTSSQIVDASQTGVDGPLGDAGAPDVSSQAEAGGGRDTQGSPTVDAPQATVDGPLGDAETTTDDALPADVTAPTLVATVPANQATGVKVDSVLTITFSEAMDPGSVEVETSPSFDLGEPAWDESGAIVSFPAPAGAWDFNTAFVVTINGKDLAGNVLATATVTFTTEAIPDTTAPTVVSSSPDSGSTVAPPNSISVVFSEPMDKTAVQAAFSLSPAPAVAGTFLWDASGQLMTYQLSAALAFGTAYTIGIGTGAKDVAGNPLATAFAASFTTSSAPDTTRPTVTITSPEDSATGAARSTNIRIAFSEPMDKASAQAAFAITSPTGVTGLFTWNASGTQMTFNPSSNFAYGTKVTVVVSTAAKDPAGNEMAAAKTFSFRVIRSTTATLLSAAALDGYVSSSGTIQATSSWVYVGDNGSNITYRGFLSFNLSVLPSTLTTITSAYLYADQDLVTGTPYGSGTSALGDVYAHSVNYGGSLTGSAYESPSLGSVRLSNTSTLGWKSASVTTLVRSDWSKRSTQASRSQFRLQFTKAVTVDGSTDYARFRAGESGSSTAPYLKITYEYP